MHSVGCLIAASCWQFCTFKESSGDWLSRSSKAPKTHPNNLQHAPSTCCNLHINYATDTLLLQEQVPKSYFSGHRHSVWVTIRGGIPELLFLFVQSWDYCFSDSSDGTWTHHSLFRDAIGWLDRQESHFCREPVWGCVCEELNVKDAYFHNRNDSLFEFMESMAVLSLCCASAYMSRADSRVGQSFGNDGRSSVRFGQSQLGFRRASGWESYL